jgi:hypothetical protein
MAIATFCLEGRKSPNRLLEQLDRVAEQRKEEEKEEEEAQNRLHVLHLNCAVLLMHARFFERALTRANLVFDRANEIPLPLAVRAGLLIAQIALLIAKEVRV